MKRFPTDDTIRNLFKRFKQGLVVEFLKEALAKLESLQGIRRVRADSGFFAEELLKYLEGRQRGYIVVAKLTPWLKREAARVTEWRALDATYAVGEFRLKLLGWDRERRFGVVREEIRESKASRGRNRNLLSKLFSRAMNWGWMEFNPAQNIGLPPMERTPSARILSPEEIGKLAANLGEMVRTVFLLGTLTGLRIGELLALKLQDVDTTHARLCVRRDVYRGQVGTPKTPGSERQVPLASPLIPILQSWLSIRPTRSDWLFPSTAGTPLRDRNLMRRHLWPACARLGIPRFGWHSLRRTFSTLNGNAGVAVPVLQSLLGHASPETSMIYTHPLEDVKRQAVEDLAGLLFPNVPSKQKLITKGSERIQ
jgi:integrase